METMGNSAFLSKKINTELDRLEEVTDIPKMDTSSEKLVVSHYDISLEHISFGYGGRQVIHDISLEIPEHTTCAIVGPSGSGKTTLCNLIARFWDVQEGTVRIGGKNVRDYTADSVLEYISMVFQNVYLFHDSVENNIRFGRPEATREQVIAAAKRACCHDFILSLPDGYDTIIGEGGSTLSGGEKQRISIARAILKDAPIIILDEATSSVDPENEQALLSAIQELTKDKTLISIAHRLSTVRNADQIIVIDQGRIVQRGTHHELLQKEGIYDNLVSDPFIDPLPYCMEAQRLFELYQNCAGRRQIETLLENYVDSMQAVKIGRGHFFFVPRDFAARLQVFEDFVEMLEEHNQLKRPDRDPLEVNSIYVVDDAKQRKKMTAAFYRSVRREIAEYEERVTHLIQSGSQSPKIMDRWVMRIQGLEEKKRNYENILKRELTDLDEEFTSLRYLSDELRIRAAGLRVHQKAA